MNFVDHPPPHFHASYSEYEAQVAIATGNVIGGMLPRRAEAMVKEWAAMHRDELEDNWRRREKLLPLNRIAPLP